MPSLIEELKRRRVFRAVVGYGVIVFTALQIIEPIMHAFHWPDSVLTYAVTALAVGFPAVVVLAWIFDLNAGRIERAAPAPSLRGVRLWLLLAGVGALCAAPGLAWYFFLHAPPSSSAQAREERPRPTAENTQPLTAPSLPPSIAVLPFADMSAAKDQEYFADGLAEELLGLLAKVPGLKVTGRTSSFAFKGKNDDLRAIAQKLGVAHILEGSVRKSGEQLRITTQLVSASDGYELWSETYDRKLTDVFAVQDEIASAVVSALKMKLLPASGEKPRGTDNIEAYNQVLLGRQFRTRGTLEDTARARQAFQRATQLDPDYAAAWAGLSRATFALADKTVSKTEAEAGFAQAKEEAGKAILIGPEVASGYVARGIGRAIRDWNWAGADEDFQRALALEPDNSEALTAYAVYLLQALGRSAEELTLLRRVTELDPLSSTAWSMLGWALLLSGDQRAAQQAIARALELAPSSSAAEHNLASSLILEGRPRDALGVLPRTIGVFALQGAALAQHSLGHRQESTRALEELIAEDAAGAAFQISEVYAWRGENDKAFEWLLRARAQRDTGIGLLKSSAFLRGLHGDPRWNTLLASVNLPVG